MDVFNKFTLASSAYVQTPVPVELQVQPGGTGYKHPGHSSLLALPELVGPIHVRG